MKLVRKVLPPFIVIYLIIVVALGIVLLFAVGYWYYNDIESNLVEKRDHVVRQLMETKDINITLESFKNDKDVVITEIESNPLKINYTDYFTREVSYHAPYSIYKVLVVNTYIEGRYYEIKLRQYTNNWFSFSMSILMYLVLSIVLMWLFIRFARWYTRGLLQPFYNSLTALRKYDLETNSQLNLPATDIEEFSLLNTTLNRIARKAHQNYISQKEFSENASHELQTPIASMRVKLELLMQSENLGREEMDTIQSIDDQLGKLSRLVKTLTLLSRIENRQFTLTEPVDMSQLAKHAVDMMEFQIDQKQLTIENQVQQKLMVNMNPTLAEVLMNNLVKNAVLHNISGGFVRISTLPRGFVIDNSGAPLRVDPDTLYQRFFKNDQASKSMGLGLALVKKICDLYNFTITYKYQYNSHHIEVRF